MKTKHTFLLLLVCLIFSCNTVNRKKRTRNVTNAHDYRGFFELKENEALQKAKSEYAFWEKKLEKEPSQYPYFAKIAASQSQLFTITGDIKYLKEAESNLTALNEKSHYTNSGSLRSLAHNYISQHRFKEALALLKKAETQGERLKATQKMLFDVHLELGNTAEAKHYLETIKNLSDFDYLIRLSKWSDHQGNLEAAIKYMEKAQIIAERSNVKSLKEWSYTNIADFYGHHGDIEKSYNHYIKALQLNPNNAYAKKGIAWIVYSHERNPEEALKILNSVSKEHYAPDYLLLKAEIASYMGKNNEKETYLETYMEAVKRPEYGDMYNAYNVLIYTDEFNQAQNAMVYAQKEVANRPTALSYDLLAWANLSEGNKLKALEIAQSHVVGKTFEPTAQYHLAEIFKANGLENEAQKIKTDLLESTYELGPLMEQEIKKI